MPDIPSTILTAQGDIIQLASIKRVFVNSSTLVIAFQDSTTLNYNYADNTAAIAARDNLAAIMEVAHVGDPEIASITPSSILQSTLPQNITVAGVAFDASATVVLRNYAGATALVTVFVSSTALTATVPNTVLVGTYDVIYSDTNGKTSVLPNSFIAF